MTTAVAVPAEYTIARWEPVPDEPPVERHTALRGNVFPAYRPIAIDVVNRQKRRVGFTTALAGPTISSNYLQPVGFQALRSLEVYDFRVLLVVLASSVRRSTIGIKAITAPVCKPVTGGTVSMEFSNVKICPAARAPFLSISIDYVVSLSHVTQYNTWN